MPKSPWRARHRRSFAPRRFHRTIGATTIGLTCLGGATAAYAQGQAQPTVSSIYQFVKARGQNSPSFDSVHLGSSLQEGSRLQTGIASKTEITYPDKSTLRLNEQTDIELQSPQGQRDVVMQRGAVFGRFHGAARFRGRFAMGTVQGDNTTIEVIEDGTRTVIRCYTGIAIITGAGATAMVVPHSETRMASDTGAAEDERVVEAFDPQTGKLTEGADVPKAKNASFIVVQPANAKFVTLHAGEETYATRDHGPVTPYKTQPLEFAGGDERPWMLDNYNGDQQVFHFGFAYDDYRDYYYELDAARDAAAPWGLTTPGIQPPPQFNGNIKIFGIPPGSLNTGVGNGNPNSPGGNVGVGVGNGNPGSPGGNVGVGIGNGNPNHPGGGVGVGIGNGNPNQPGGNVGVGIGNGNPNQPGGNLQVIIGRAATRSTDFFPNMPQVGGVFYTTTYSNSAFTYARASAVLGPFYLRVGGRIGYLDHEHDTSAEEFVLRYRSLQYGDIMAGRFHWYPGPVSNGQLGKLINFTTANGIIVQNPVGQSTRVQLTWMDKIDPINNPGVGGYAGYVTFPERQGRIGGSILTTSQQTVGYSFHYDTPVVLHHLEMYTEAGKDTAHHDFYTVGAFFPGLFQHHRLDVSLEYAFRGSYGDSWDLDVHYPFHRYGAGLFTLTKAGGASFRPGIGLQLQF
ncbi:MAG TPA: FecR domain-containing protein [Chthonomonadaceae bacterium]|nr:FecR domain-containing protein [Chthonomonadaceae bacterium]